jgi:shikimate dehydrogenase
MTAPTDLYCVAGNPIEHSRSPQIHHAFADQFGHNIHYSRLLAPIDAFAQSVMQFREQGGLGMNVTTPFKEQALALADQASLPASAAGAANTLSFVDGLIHADNTDGPGLVNDLIQRHQLRLDGADVVILGAGGAARGVVLPLAQASVRSILIANRTEQRASDLVVSLKTHVQPTGVSINSCSLDSLRSVASQLAAPVWINATAAGLNSQDSPVDAALLTNARIAYDMFYASQPTPFMQAAEQADCPLIVDGLGMLVEQAACSYRIWRGVTPETQPVYSMLRS